MAELATIARPYAEAVFRLSSEQGEVNQWNEWLNKLAGLVNNPEITAIISHPNVLADQLKNLFTSFIGNSNRSMNNFLQTLIENRRLTILPQIALMFEQLRQASAGEQTAQIACAFPLAEQQIKSLLAKLEQHFKTRLTAEVTVDPALIGGFLVTVGDKVLDASVKGKLEAMSSTLKN